MTNRLITVEEAARDFTEALNGAVEELRAEGIPDEKIARGIEDVFARIGGFPARMEEA